MRSLTEVCNFCTSARSCSISVKSSGNGWAEVDEMVGAATSTILSASSAISSRVVVGLVAASTMRTFDGRR